MAYEKIDDAIWGAWERVERIHEVRVIPDSLDTLLRFVEKPFQEAVGIFYTKNIQTIGSSCNYADYCRGFAWISLDGAGLTPANNAVVNRYEHADRTTIDGTDKPIIGLLFPIDEQELPEIIGERATALAQIFENQPEPTCPWA